MNSVEPSLNPPPTSKFLDQPLPTPHHAYVMKTSIGNLTVKVLGDDDNEVAAFDGVCAAIKAAKVKQNLM